MREGKRIWLCSTHDKNKILRGLSILGMSALFSEVNSCDA